MPNDVARNLARCRKGLVVAPAGCGKTHLIAESVGHCTGRQLILTHTHAGVRAIIDHLRRRGIDPRNYRVSTIDGFALRYASAFSSLSGWTELQPTGSMWTTLRPAATKTLAASAVKRVVSCSYAGVYVDEYQDCSVGQHDLMLAVSQILPVRVLGDPLQSVFWKVNKGDNVVWKDVDCEFPLVGQLSVPHRWADRNEDLGNWLLDVRKRLLEGKPIDLRAGPISWNNTVEPQSQIGACYKVISNGNHSVLGVHAWGHQCHKLARSLNGTYRSMETVECGTLLEWAGKIESATGAQRACLIIEFAQCCISRLPQVFNTWKTQLSQGTRPSARREDYKRTIECLLAVCQNPDLNFVAAAFDAIEHIDGQLVYGRLELWREMRRTLAAHARTADQSLSEAAWHQRNRARHVGRRVDRRCLATTLLAKGLEFDHAVVLNVDDLEDAENVYVAMTRGCRSLTVFSASATIQRGRPHSVS